MKRYYLEAYIKMESPVFERNELTRDPHRALSWHAKGARVIVKYRPDYPTNPTICEAPIMDIFFTRNGKAVVTIVNGQTLSFESEPAADGVIRMAFFIRTGTYVDVFNAAEARKRLKNGDKKVSVTDGNLITSPILYFIDGRDDLVVTASHRTYHLSALRENFPRRNDIIQLDGRRRRPSKS